MKNNILNNQFNRINFKYRVKKGYTSVIIPVYKDVVGLKDTLESLQKQTLDNNNFEIIVANDGADLEISKLCKEFNIAEVKIKPNKGSYNARNKALELSRGEFIAFTDADVKVKSNWLKNGLKVLGENFSYIGGPVIIDKSKVKNISNYYEIYYNPFPIETFFKEKHFFPTANVFTKRTVIQNLGGFDRRLQSSGDLEFGNRVKFYSKYKTKFVEEIAVIHPPRNYKSLINKIARVAKGEKDLYMIYSERFSYLKRSFLLECKVGLIPVLPNRKEAFNKKRLKLFALNTIFQYYRFFQNVKYLR